MNPFYLQRMQNLLNEEFDAYMQSLEKDTNKGMRVNTLKISIQDFFRLTNWALEKSPFADNGYYLDRDRVYGNTLPFEAGLFYMQEPSASSPVSVLDVQRGDYVLDMCAAPGSKSTQIAEKLENTGLLVTNEINTSRARILVENIGKYGAANVVVLNNDTSALSKSFPACFDKVLVDAPCSGEGMMRKNDEASKQWSLDNIHHCADMQKQILENAYICLRKGGILVYSTCTFAPEENEQQISSFLQRHEDMELVPIEVQWGRPGIGMNEARRIFPMDNGEGHFICKLHKKGEEERNRMAVYPDSKLPPAAQEFLDTVLNRPYPHTYVFKDKVYGGMHPFIKTANLHLVRNQVLLGEVKKNRFEPAHTLFTNSYSACKQTVELEEDQIQKYLRGETLMIVRPKGWYAVTYKGYAIAGAYSDGKMLKNKYPHSLRKR